MALSIRRSEYTLRVINVLRIHLKSLVHQGCSGRGVKTRIVKLRVFRRVWRGLNT